jgi:peptide-methionine (R)-S-oxide reductase
MAQDMKQKSDEYWKQKLTTEQYHVLREKGTERPGTGKFYQNFAKGMYMCAACGEPLFSSETKFDSDCGWPSFDRSLEGNVEFHEDTSLGMTRREVLCKNCGSHLGHVFDDGPKETTGKRFCINSLSLNFKGEK